MRVVSFLVLFFVSSSLLAQPAPASAPMPTEIDVPAGAHLVLEAKGSGSQIYVCAMRGETSAWQFQAPDAKLKDQSGHAIGIHSAGPSWRLSDGSEIKGTVIGSKPSPEANSIPWLLLRVASHSGTGQLSQVDYVRRTGTHGGATPTSGCDSRQTGAQSRVPYSAIYSFYAKD